MSTATRHGYVVLGGLAIAALTLRPQLVGLGPILTQIQDDLGISHAVAGLLVTIPVLCMGIFAPPAAYLAVRVGAGRAVAVALGLIATFGLLRAVAPGAPLVILLTIPIGIGMGLGNALMPVAVKERFAARALLATSIYAIGIQIGSTLSAGLAVPLADTGSGDDGWRITLLVYSLLSVACLGIWLVIGRGPRPHRPAGPVRPPRLPWRSFGPWLLAVLFLLVTILYYGLGAWLPDALQEHGFSESSGGILVALLNAATVCATIAVGLFGERAGSRRRLMVAAGIFLLVGTLGVVLLPAAGWLWAVSCGCGIGTFFPVLMNTPVDIAARPEGVGAIAGLMLGVGYVLAAPAPFVLGAIRDATGSFSASMWVLVGIAAVLLAVATTASRERLRRGVP